MKNLKSTDKLQYVASSATPTIKWSASWIESPSPFGPSDSVTPDHAVGSAASTSAQDMIAAPASGYVRNVKEATWYNAHASTSCTITVQVDRSATTYIELAILLLAGETLKYAEGVFFHYDVSGGVYGPSLPAASTTVAGAIEVADQTEMESASATDKAVTPGRQQYHPSAVKAWGKASGDGTTLNASYNIASLTDTGPGQLTWNIDVDFSGAHYSVTASVERSSTSLSVTNLKFVNIRNATQAAGSVLTECYDGTATTATQEDPSAYHIQCCGDQ